jgi:hypothetical protein
MLSNKSQEYMEITWSKPDEFDSLSLMDVLMMEKGRWTFHGAHERTRQETVTCGCGARRAHTHTPSKAAVPSSEARIDPGAWDVGRFLRIT